MATFDFWFVSALSTYLEESCRIHPETIRARLSHQDQGSRVINCQEGIEHDTTEGASLGLWLSSVLQNNEPGRFLYNFWEKQNNDFGLSLWAEKIIVISRQDGSRATTSHRQPWTIVTVTLRLSRVWNQRSLFMWIIL